jgi:hypothetical protein
MIATDAVHKPNKDLIQDTKGESMEKTLYVVRRMRRGGKEKERKGEREERRELSKMKRRFYHMVIP